jgi:uncharacterized membrane protein YccC
MNRLKRFLKNRFIEHVELRVDVTRACRATVAFAVPLAVCHWLDASAEAIFISTAALNLSLPDLRGAYRVRLGILGTMTLVAAGSALLGVMSAGSALGAVAGMGLVALFGGVWRHLSADYGPSMATSSALLFLLGLSQPGDWRAGLHLAGLVALGDAFAIFLHAGHWFFRPQHALRYAVAETWVAASDMVAAMRLDAAADKNARNTAIARQERELRAALDRTFVILGAEKNRRSARLLAHLEEMRLEVVHFSMRVIAFNTALESIGERPEFARCLPVADSVLKALSDAARSVAITLIMHRAENFAATNVRLQRCAHLIKTLTEQIAAVPAGDGGGAPAQAALKQIERLLARVQAALRETTEPAAARPIFSAGLPDISSYSLKSLGAWAHPAARLDPVLVRHAVRMAVFTMFAVALYKGFGIARGYWIAFTIMVVLQPDYGSTRQRAVARIGGTVTGIVLAGGLFWLKPPLFWLDALAVATAFFFAYFLKRRYWLAIFFVTINLVLVTEALTEAPGNFMIVRVLATLLGGILALVAARIFWPVWEGENFPKLLASAIRANRTFLLAQSPAFGLTPPEAVRPLMAKRRAENANRYVAASVERLLGEPSGLQENPERAAALGTYNQRVTRALTALAVQTPSVGAPPAAAADWVRKISAVLEHLAQVIEQGCPESAVASVTAELEKLETEFTGASNPAGVAVNGATSPENLTWIQLAKTIAEIRAMTLALKMTPSAPGKAS